MVYYLWFTYAMDTERGLCQLSAAYARAGIRYALRALVADCGAGVGLAGRYKWMESTQRNATWNRRSHAESI